MTKATLLSRIGWIGTPFRPARSRLHSKILRFFRAHPWGGGVRKSCLAAAVALACGGLAVAQSPLSPNAPVGKSPATTAYEAASMRMHKDMGMAYTGDADVDFARSMIPHHQGAIDMARIVLQHGKDPELRKLAEDIISAQEREIAFLQDWLKKRGH
jgi:hypothetical protein